MRVYTSRPLPIESCTPLMSAALQTTSGKVVRQDNVMFNTDVVRGNTWATAALTKMKEAQPAPKKSPPRCLLISGTCRQPLLSKLL